MTSRDEMIMVKVPLGLVKRIRDEFDGIVAFSTAEAMKVKARGAPTQQLDEAANSLITMNRLLTACIQEATRLEEADPKLPPLPTPQSGETWRHFKGDEVAIHCVARHSETKERVVVYDHLGEPWIRPLAMWHDAEPKMGGRRRFEFVADEKAT